MKELAKLFLLTFLFTSANLLGQEPIVVGNCNVCKESTEDLFQNLVQQPVFSTSNGTPSWGANEVWMWSMSTIGEGVFADFDFREDIQYCIEVDITLSMTPSTFNPTLSPNAKFKIVAANGLVHYVSTSSGSGIPTPSNQEVIYQGNYSSFTLNQRYTIRIPYTPNNPYSQIWFYPQGNLPGATGSTGAQAELLLHSVKIVEEHEPKANAKFVCPRGTRTISTPHGPFEITQLCLLDDLKIDGSASGCEDRYYVELAEYNQVTGVNTNVLYSQWVLPLQPAPNNIIINQLLPAGYQLRPGIIYRFKLAVGNPWDSKILFFEIVCCDEPCREPNPGIPSTGHPDPESESTQLIDPFVDSEAVIIYPNPTSGNITLDFKDLNLDDSEIQIQIFNFMGIEKLTKTTKEAELKIDAKNWKTGTYICKIKIGDHVFTKAIIKE